MILAKMLTLGLLKIKLFWNKSYDVIISAFDITNRVLSYDSNYIVDALVWPKFGNSSISKGFDQKNYFFEGRTWFKFNNLELLVGVILKVNTNVAKGLILKVKTFVEITEEILLCTQLFLFSFLI